WSSLVARRAHNPKVVGSNPAPATNIQKANLRIGFFRFSRGYFSQHFLFICFVSLIASAVKAVRFLSPLRHCNERQTYLSRPFCILGLMSQLSFITLRITEGRCRERSRVRSPLPIFKKPILGLAFFVLAGAF